MRSTGDVGEDEEREGKGGGWVVEREMDGKGGEWGDEGDREVTEFSLWVVVVLEGVSDVYEEGTRGEVGLGGTFRLEIGVSALAPGLPVLTLAISPSGSKSSANFLRFEGLSFELAPMAARSWVQRKPIRGSSSSKP